YRKVMRMSLWPSSCIRAGRLTPSRSISVAKDCRRRCGTTRPEQPARCAALANVERIGQNQRRGLPQRGSNKVWEGGEDAGRVLGGGRRGGSKAPGGGKGAGRAEARRVRIRSTIRRTSTSAGTKRSVCSLPRGT